jgi:hypothetical protein
MGELNKIEADVVELSEQELNVVAGGFEHLGEEVSKDHKKHAPTGNEHEWNTILPVHSKL